MLALLRATTSLLNYVLNKNKTLMLVNCELRDYNPR